MSVADLSNYKSFAPTNSCYLDGRYFNKVFNSYPGLIRNPLRIHIAKSGKEVMVGADMENTQINNRNYLGLLRVIIETPHSRHSNLLIINYQEKKIMWFEPYEHGFISEVKKTIKRYLGIYFDFKVQRVTQVIVKGEEVTPGCERSGFCMAYVIKYAYDTVLNQPFDGSEIRRFASCIESKLGPLTEGNADEEYGWLDEPQNRNLVIGGLGGAAIGGLVGGPTGFLVGGAVGALGGYALTPR